MLQKGMRPTNNLIAHILIICNNRYWRLQFIFELGTFTALYGKKGDLPATAHIGMSI